MLAIIIPYYKKTFFEETLQSLANQIDKRFKVYIGDDASPENPSELIAKYIDQLDLVYQRFESNLGGISLVQQWNRCIDLSRDEEWLMILGDDDFLGENCVASWYENHDLFSNKSQVVRFSSKLVFEEDNTISNLFEHPVWEMATDSFYRKYQNITRSSLSEYIFSRKSFIKYGFCDYPLAWNSDDRAWLDFSDEKPIFTINECTVFVRISSLNISGKTDNIYDKSLSQIKFYRFLVSNKLEKYDKHQRDHLMRRYENEIINIRDINLEEWLYLLFFYIKYFDVYLFKKFIKRFLNTMLKRHEH
ncbi:glycosyltransferase [Flavobacterium faecale]|uniref:glycosyltransferase n=1 Tax=Flavobacterium faecale TaxID=1355330 RepID=UPI003AB0D0B9